MSAETTEAPNLKNAYTDSPELFSNVILAGFQIIFWMVFHPLALENYLKRAEPKISDNISLLGVIRDRGKNRFEKAVVVNLYLVLPITSIIFFGLALWLLDRSTNIFISTPVLLNELNGFNVLTSALDLYIGETIFFLLSYYVALFVIHHFFEYRLGLVASLFIALPNQVFFLFATIEFYDWQNFFYIILFVAIINFLTWGITIRIATGLLKNNQDSGFIYSKKMLLSATVIFGLIWIISFRDVTLLEDALKFSLDIIFIFIENIAVLVLIFNLSLFDHIKPFKKPKNADNYQTDIFQSQSIIKHIIKSPYSFKAVIVFIFISGTYPIAFLLGYVEKNLQNFGLLLTIIFSSHVALLLSGKIRKTRLLALNRIIKSFLIIIPISVLVLQILFISWMITIIFSDGLYTYVIEYNIGEGFFDTDLFISMFVFVFMLWGVFGITYYVLRRLTTWRFGWVFALGGALLGMSFQVSIVGLRIYELLWINYDINEPLMEALVAFVWLGVIGIVAILGYTYFLWGQLISYLPYQIWAFVLFLIEKLRGYKSPSLLRYHPVFVDQFLRLQLFGLDKHLIWVATQYPQEGQQALDYLAISRQRKVVQRVLVELDAVQLEKSTSVESIAHVQNSLKFGELTGPANTLLRSFNRISEETETALGYGSIYHQRLSLNKVEESLNSLLREMQRSNERYEKRFYPIAQKWQQIIHQHVEKLQEESEADELIENPYVIFVPLRPGGEIDTFVGRGDESARIERLLMSRQSPPLLLYGQRRMGKTSLLKNLGRLLPKSVVPLYVDLQGFIENAQSYESFFLKIAEEMTKSAKSSRGLELPTLTSTELASDPFITFDHWLDEIEKTARTENDHAILLELDEFESLENAFKKGILEENAVLGMLRHIIQHRDRFKILLSGSHAIQEFDQWASYLINTQVIHISYLKESEAMQLIERPYASFPLRYEPEASARVFSLTRGHPGLLQLFCSEMVDYKNEQEPADRRFATLDDIEAVVPIVLKSGREFFATLEHDQVDQTGRALLNFIAAQGEGVAVSEDRLQQALPTPDDLAQTLKLLERRELIEKVDGGYRFQVELIRCWFAWQER